MYQLKIHLTGKGKKRIKYSTLNIVTAGPSLNYPSSSKSSSHKVFHLLAKEQAKIQMIFTQFKKLSF